MKIGILTFHCAHNYGAVLQCYALQEYLKGLGHDVEIIDYRPNYLLTPYKIFKVSETGSLISRFKSFVKALLMLRRSYIRHKKFDSFINNFLNLSKERNHIPGKYDVYITGSDQVWNPQITNGFDSNYFAEYPFHKSNKIYISYAASMEAKELSKSEFNYYKNHLNNFDYISVRENVLADLLQSLAKNKVVNVLDPTLLVKRKVWDKIAVKPKYKGKYVLVYQVGVNDNTMNVANIIAQSIGGEVIEITAWMNEWRYNRLSIQTASPEEFLGYFKYASYIVTTSFHGTAFAIINNKPFFYLQVGNGTRVSSLLSQLNLEDRIIHENYNINSQIDWDNVNDILNKKRASSYNFLINSVNNE